MTKLNVHTFRKQSSEAFPKVVARRNPGSNKQDILRPNREAWALASHHARTLELLSTLAKQEAASQ